MIIAQFCKKWSIREFLLFGSVLIEYIHKDNDIDVLVTFDDDEKHTLFDLVHMQDQLKEIFKREVDIVSRWDVEALRPLRS